MNWSSIPTYALALAWPLFAAGAVLLLFAWYWWRTRFERGNGRPAVPCKVCGRMFQRGLPLHWHVTHHHNGGV